jgi:enamine deaminase RidA (YjgF/YER057c/UK114 family)
VRHVHQTGGFEDVAGYSRAVRVGDHIAVSTTAPIDEAGQTLFPGDTYQQTRFALERAVEAVVALGGAVTDVTRTRLYLIREADWRQAVDAHMELFADVRPANSTFYVEGFIPPNVLVEVELDAILSS